MGSVEIRSDEEGYVVPVMVYGFKSVGLSCRIKRNSLRPRDVEEALVRHKPIDSKLPRKASYGAPVVSVP